MAPVRALLSRAPGAPSSLEMGEVASVPLGPGDVRVRVAACGVNFPDVLIIADRYQLKPPRPFAPGAEVSGVVCEIGSAVDSLAVGDRVMADTRYGGMAEEVVAPASSVVPIPDDMPFDEAAAFLLAYGTAYYALKLRGRLLPGEHVLVLGAAGGVGVASIQVAKALGARVTAAVSSEDKAALRRSAGADETLIYPAGALEGQERALAEDLKSRTRDRTGFDVILDPIGGPYAEPSLRAMAWNGRYLVVGFAAGEIPRIPLNLPLLKGCDVIGVHWGAWVAREPEAHKAAMAALLQHYGRGELKPLISRRFPLEQGADAIEHLASRAARGKVVVTVP